MGKKTKKKMKRSFLDNQRKHMMERKNPLKSDESGKKKHKFTSFYDAVSQLDSSIVYKLAGIGGVQPRQTEDTDSVLSVTLNHWRELNLSTDFTICCRKLSRYVSLPQVNVNKSYPYLFTVI